MTNETGWRGVRLGLLLAVAGGCGPGGGTTETQASTGEGTTGASDPTTPTTGATDPTDPTDTTDTNGGVDQTVVLGFSRDVDLLFVVDNSGSMADEQEALAKSFNGFITSIQDTVMAKDYHIMVIDTDAGNAFEQSCFVLCQLLPVCEGYACDNLPVVEGCDAMLGTGLINDPNGTACGVTGGERFMVDAQQNLSSTFQCLAKVGTDGDGSERPMEAMIAAVTSLNGAGACNEGFLRKDALLVVTFITDEEDDGQSKGTPAGWQAALVAAKVGAEKSIVVLGLIGDPEQPNPVCGPDAAEASPRLRSFAESFTFGSTGSICSPDYAPFFDASVSVIDTACQQFEPPG